MHKKNKVILTCTDHTVSDEKFNLLYDEERDMLVTDPRPEPENLGRYYESEAYISHTDADKSLMDKVYQMVKNYTIRNKVKLIRSFQTEGKSILDIGCGTGEFLKACENNGWRVCGIEPNEKARTNTKNKISSSDKAIFENIETLMGLSSSPKFDVITLWHVLEHVPNLEEYLNYLKQLLKPKGVLIIAVPNYKSFDAKHYKEFWAAYDVPRHLWHFSNQAIRVLFKEVEMEVVKVLPMKFDSFYVSLLSEKFKHGRYNIFKAFWIGLRSNLMASKNLEYSSLIYIIQNVN